MLINARDAHMWRCTPFSVLGNLNIEVDWACRTKPLCTFVGGRDQIVGVKRVGNGKGYNDSHADT